MFTIEHEFDATVVTLIDDVAAHREEDVTITLFEECVTIEQYDELTEEVSQITLSAEQLSDLVAAVDLPEGAYRREPKK